MYRVAVTGGGDRRCCHPVASPSDYPGSAEHNEWGSSPAQINLVSVGGGELCEDLGQLSASQSLAGSSQIKNLSFLSWTHTQHLLAQF